MLQIQSLNIRSQQTIHEAVWNFASETVVVQVQILYGGEHWGYWTGETVVAEIDGRDCHLVNRLDWTGEEVPLQLEVDDRETEDLSWNGSGELV